MVVIIEGNSMKTGGAMSLLSRLAHSIYTFPLLATIVGPPNLHAAPILVTYQFTGTCADCTGTGTGLLTLENYTPGTSMKMGNFVSFTYDSNLTSYSFTSSDQLSFFTGLIADSLPAASFVYIVDNSARPNYFASSLDGTWCVGTYCSSDNGLGSSWAEATAAPEPATWFLVVPAIFGFLYHRRRLSNPLH